MAPAIMAPESTTMISTRTTITVAIPAIVPAAALAVLELHFPMVPIQCIKYNAW